MDIKFFKIFEKYCLSNNYIFKSKIKNLLYSYFFTYIFIIISYIVIINPLEFIIINILGFDSVLDEIKKNSFKLCNLKIATIIIIIPFFEELIFRLSLKPKIQYLFISFF